MREIRFRAWDTQEKKILDFLPAAQSNNMLTLQPANNRYVILQFTYQGFITLLTGVIEFDKGGFWCKPDDKSKCSYSVSSMVQHLEVIGNIYENPGLKEI